jgi:hypothetical protein
VRNAVPNPSGAVPFETPIATPLAVGALHTRGVNRHVRISSVATPARRHCPHCPHCPHIIGINAGAAALP